MIFEIWIQNLVSHPFWDGTKGHNSFTQDVATIIMVTFSTHSMVKALWLETWDTVRQQLIMILGILIFPHTKTEHFRVVTIHCQKKDRLKWNDCCDCDLIKLMKNNKTVQSCLNGKSIDYVSACVWLSSPSSHIPQRTELCWQDHVMRGEPRQRGEMHRECWTVMMKT